MIGQKINSGTEIRKMVNILGTQYSQNKEKKFVERCVLLVILIKPSLTKQKNNEMEGFPNYHCFIQLTHTGISSPNGLRSLIIADLKV